ncbi:asparagine synthase (glutamine-hydrolyzing) [Bosea sp. (in: a-proteobacteria)]|uniref:asparagine synthase (glutamine-hydrolyzing) n=1 Tax=Bosea sp. (in: a-proteobacteria) TaxID=1871050 RepID=UPI002610A8CE|nr:asparagine synthase (glutamine-hydrolyzing) [Bosea sp. (in: a-proteobacteria)]MCO5090847.1 asparagine synthase (glutamine-hydrolyzing) [Bosea sp. (in: a-proteobacteria)]
MCGIAGWVGRKVENPERRAAEMSQAIRHRGPDAEGIAFLDSSGGEEQVALVHRRLAIIDLAADSNQPMQIDNGRLRIVFNGEIYNYIELREELSACGHRFRTQSDTEVLLRAYDQWRLAMFDRLNGMFAFALWDAEHDELVLARDPFGKKPLYLAQDDGRLTFASEINALRAVEPDIAELDPQAVRDYLHWRYVPGPHTFFERIRKLDPGSYAVWSQGELRQTRYYTPPDRYPRAGPVERQGATGRFLERLDHSVRIRMRADVPFGAFLSGGLDSSAIVALMSRHSDKAIRTFSVGFGEDGLSELPFARRVADRFKTDHCELVIRADDIMDNLPRIVRHQGGPVVQSSDIPIYLLSVRAARDVRMVLTGEGSDEILGGYPKHRAEALAGLYRGLVPQALHGKVLMPLLRALGFASARLETFAVSAGERDFAERMISWFGGIAAGERDALAAGLGERQGERNGFPFSSSEKASHLRRVLFFDQTSWLPDNLLERGDRMMMAGSIEGRMPFLDRDLVAFVSTLPDRYRLGRHSKQILRDAIAPMLPDEILSRRKIGFKVPVGAWFRGPMRAYVREHLCSSASVIRSYLSAPLLDRIVAEHESGAADREKLIWALLNLEIFHRECGLGAPR